VLQSVRDEIGTLGVGLRGMNERVRQLGGKFEIASNHHGTTIRASIPLPKNMPN
jgi:signal transduction histidine kinase